MNHFLRTKEAFSMEIYLNTRVLITVQVHIISNECQYTGEKRSNLKIVVLKDKIIRLTKKVLTKGLEKG